MAIACRLSLLKSSRVILSPSAGFQNNSHPHPMKNNLLINRRTCLKGIGATLALPFLESLSWAEAGKATSFKPPVRLGFMYMPHGVIMDQFWPADAESFLASPPPALESLRPVLEHCLMMK